MSAYVVYIDVLLLLNFCFDFLLLAASGRFLRRRAALLRLLLASALGAVYGAAIVLPQLSFFYLPPAAVLFSLLLLRIAYPYRSAGAFLKLTGVFYLIAFAMAGAVLAGVTLLQNSGFVLGGQTTVRAGSLLAALPVAAIIARRGYAAFRRNWRKEDFHVQMEIWVAGRSCMLTALLDTGNDLHEPLSGRPVIVADGRAVRGLLPERIREIWQANGERPDLALQQLTAKEDIDGWVRRLRLIPFASIGKRNGMLLGFRPDAIFVQQNGQRLQAQAVIALTRLASDQAYQAVANPEILTAEQIEIMEVGA